MSRYAVLADIHGNLYALKSVMEDISSRSVDKIILLGDLVDYGMQSNEVIDFINKELHIPIIVNIWGNHEKAIIDKDFSRFSGNRGVESAKYTEKTLSESNKSYLRNDLIKDGKIKFEIEGHSCLAVHGSLEDPYWKSISHDNLRGDYRQFDIVFSGHSHYSHCFRHFYDADNEIMRNKHAVLFINPGSVGQPRNHNPNAQYAIFDAETKSVELNAVRYDIDSAMALFNGQVDDFYRDRLLVGV